MTDAAPDLDAFVQLWACAKTYWAARDFPKYGSATWVALAPDDPRRTRRGRQAQAAAPAARHSRLAAHRHPGPARPVPDMH